MIYITFSPTFSSLQVKRIEYEKMSFNNDARIIGKWLKKISPKETRIAVVLAGIVPFYSELYTIDMLGLNDLHIAHKKTTNMEKGEAGHEKHDSEYVLSKRPDLIFMSPFYLYENQISDTEIISHYRSFSRWAPGNKTMLENEYFWKEYRLVTAKINGKYFPFFIKKSIFDSH